MRSRFAVLLLLVVSVWLPPLTPQAAAQQKGVPGKFDFYLLDMPWGPEFCAIKDVSAQCKPQHGFVVHGLWPQNNDGTWPVFCSKEAGPEHLEPFLKLTPDLQLLQHEWDKHGTCSAVGRTQFFVMEQEAFRKVKIPAELVAGDHDLAFTPEWILRSLEFANPTFPEGSFALSCKDGKLTAVEACFDKDLHAVRCAGLRPCQANVLTVQASGAPSR